MSWTSVSVHKYIQTLFRCLALSQPHLAPIKAELLITTWQSGTRNHCSAARLSSCLHVHAHANTPNTTLLPLWSPAELHIPLGPLCLRVILLPAASGPWFQRLLSSCLLSTGLKATKPAPRVVGWMLGRMNEWMDGWMRPEAAPPLAAGGAGCAACVDRSNERGVPVWRVAPALSLSLWPWLPVISHPLSESILGSYATRASIERPESLSVSPHFGFFFSISSFYFPLICFIPVLDFSLCFLHHLWVAFVTLGAVLTRSNKLFTQSQNCAGLKNFIQNCCFFFFF